MIAILGSGMSALFAAWACIEEGAPFEMFSNTMSEPKVLGFQYLASPCNLPVASTTLYRSVTPVRQSTTPVSEQYNMKVYEIPDLSSELDHFVKEELIWNLKDAVSILWQMIRHEIQKHEFSSLQEIEDFAKAYDVVFSTIPLNNLWVEGLQCAFRYMALMQGTEKSFCVYNTSRRVPWYRLGSVFGHGFVEFSLSTAYSIGPYKITKVIGRSELELRKNVVLCGRYGAWDRTVRVDDVYYQVKEYLRR